MRGHCNYSSGEEGGHERRRKGHCHNDSCGRDFGPWAHLMSVSQGFGPPHHGHHRGPHFHGPHFHGPHAFGPHHGPHHHGHHHGPHKHRHHRGPFGRGPFGRGPWHHHHGGPFSGPFGPCGRSETFGACGRTVTFGPCGRSDWQSEGQCCNNEERNRCKQTRKNKPSTSQDKDGNAETVLVQRIVVEHPSRSVSV